MRMRVLAIEELGERLAEAYAPEEVARIVAAYARDALACESVALAVVDEVPGELSVIEALNVDEALLRRYPSFSEDAMLPLAVAHRERRAIFFEDVEALGRTEPELAEIVRGWKRAAGASLPLLVGGRSLGAIGFGFPPPAELPPGLRDLMAVIARQAAIAIERATLVARAQRETKRIRYLAHAGALLASTTEARATLATLTELAVPELADWAAVDLFVGDGRVDRVSVVHTDPAKVALVEELVRRYPPDLDDPTDGLGNILRTGQPQLVPHIPPELLEAAAKDEAHLRIMRELGMRSYVCVPIASRDRVRGAFTLISAESGRRYGEDDLELALEIARRASIALDVADVLADVRRAEQRATRADRQKDEFLAMLGHELRNPLAAIAAAGDLMQMRGRGSDPLTERAHDAIRRQVQHMKRLIDDLLDVARISRGKLTLERDRIDARELLRHVLDDHQSEIEAAAVAVGLEVPAEAVIVHGDRTRLAQVVANLLLNASKFTPAGGRIDVRLSASQNEAILEIADTGIGIGEAALAELFEPFVQPHRREGETRGGLGLGLALVKRLVELHGGEVGARSEGEGKGATFTVRLPLAEAGDAVAAEPTAPGAGPMRVLIVEDDPDAGDMLQAFVETFGHHVALAPTGARGLELAREHPPDLVLCDIGLGEGMDGYAVARALRADPSAGQPYLVAVTGFGLPEHAARASEAGFDRYYTKPISVEELRKLFELARG